MRVCSALSAIMPVKGGGISGGHTLFTGTDALRRQFPDEEIFAAPDAMDAVSDRPNHPVNTVYPKVQQPF